MSLWAVEDIQTLWYIFLLMDLMNLEGIHYDISIGKYLGYGNMEAKTLTHNIPGVETVKVVQNTHCET